MRGMNRIYYWGNGLRVREFSAYAGMNLSIYPFGMRRLGVFRVCGDEPLEPEYRAAIIASFPRMRG